MPELPEVETIVRGLAASITGRSVRRVVLSRPDVVHANGVDLEHLLPGRRVAGVTRRGKRIRLGCDGPVELTFHLGMSGQLTLTAASQTVASHTHLRILLDGDDCELRFRDPRRFGGVWVSGGAGAVQPGLSRLGIEPLSASFAEFRAVLARRRQIKALLLDQSLIAGLGNIYCDEVLHRAGIHPLTAASALSHTDARRLWDQMRRTLRSAIRAGGSSISDYVDAGGYQRRHLVYGRAGEPCRECGTIIVRSVVASRGTHSCPKCQPPPR